MAPELTTQTELSFAKRRLWRDWQELQAEGITTVAAAPSNDFFLWHGNLRPPDGPYAGTVFHILLYFPTNYPREPPTCFLCSKLCHPNVFRNGHEFWVCLDMLKFWTTSEPYKGWTSAYTLTSILLQLQSFFFADRVEQDYGGDAQGVCRMPQCIQHAILRARAFTCEIEDVDGNHVVHTHDNPWPPFTEPMQNQNEMGVLERPFKRARLLLDEQPAWKTLEHFPNAVFTHIFGFLNPQDLFRARNVCRQWRRVIITYALFERSQLSCYYSKKRVDDPNCILGVGVKVQYTTDTKRLRVMGLKEASSPLDLLSLDAFSNQHVRAGVWAKEGFEHFLPLILTKNHAQRSVLPMERSIYSIMKDLPPPLYAILLGNGSFFQPYMVLELLSTLMNTMVVELMKQVPAGGQSIQRHASEKALEGYCAFCHALLFFAQKYPIIQDMANRQVDEFVASSEKRHKTNTPNLGTFLVALNLSDKNWSDVRLPFLLETLDRNVLWVIKAYPCLDDLHCHLGYRMSKTFDASLTSLRLLMFQVHFLTCFKGTGGPAQTLKQYNQRLGRPTTAQKEDLQTACKEILAVRNWTSVFQRIQHPVPERDALGVMLQQAVVNSRHKGYHGGRWRQWYHSRNNFLGNGRMHAWHTP